MTSNAELLRRSLRAVWHPCTQMKHHEQLPLVPISRASGVWLYDFEGHRYLDAVSSWWVNLFGHGQARIAKAISRQAGELDHVMLAGFTHRPAVELAERLSQAAPGELGHAFFGSDGASATEIALKMSFHYWRNSGSTRKTQFIGLANGYHGETLGALGVTDIALFRDAYGPILRPQPSVPSPDWRASRMGETHAQCALRAAAALQSHLERNHEVIAAFIAEPLVQGAAGMAMHHPVYLQRTRELCTRYGVHWIADEIMVGFGRTGTLFACEQGGVAPDFLCLSKAITGGFLPLSVVLTTDAVYEGFYHEELSRGFLHSHSYSGNPLACAAACAVLDTFHDDAVIARNRENAVRFDGLFDEIAHHPKVRDFRRTGMIWAFEVTSARPDFARWCFGMGLERELLLRPIGNTVYFMPPYTIGDEEMALLAERTMAIVDRA